VKQQRALQVRRDAATLSSELVQRADALFTAGRGTKADTYSARVNLGNDRIAVQNQAIVLARAQADLAFVLGLSSDGLEVVPPTTVTGNAAPSVQEPPPLPDLLTYARRARPLLAARRLAGEAADLDVSRAQGAWWPVVGLQGNYQRQSPDLTGSFGLFGDLAHQYTATAQVTLAWNLFAGGETRAGVDRAAVQARRAWTLAEQGEQTVFSELSVAREQVVALAGSVATAQEIQDAAEKALRFARERLEAGVGSQLEVRDAVLKLEDARLTWINTVVDLVVARADLNRATGGSL
jgi:outer membrane protein TolC